MSYIMNVKTYVAATFKHALPQQKFKGVKMLSKSFYDHF